MGVIGTIGIFIGIVLIVFLSVRGVSVLIAAPLATLVVILTNQMDIFKTMLGTTDSYMSNLASFVINYFALFLLGSILAQFMDESGAAQSIAQKVLEKIGTEKPFQVLVALYIISALLTYGGISVFVVLFVLVPLARSLFKKLDIAWNLVSLPVILGSATFTMTMLPGTPSIQNAIPVSILGTTLTAAPLLGIIGSVTCIAVSMFYMKKALDKSIARGETYSDFVKENTADNEEEAQKALPGFISSILPLVLLITIILAGSFFKIDNILAIGLISAILISMLLFRNFVSSQKMIINTGAQKSLSPVFLTSSAVAFGGVVTAASGFTVISDFILNLPGNPVISASLASGVFGGITGSSSGAIGIVLNTFGDSYINMGVNPAVLHRVVVMASAVLANMPHSGVVLTMLTLCGLSHKQGFKHMFQSFTLANLFSLVVVILAAILFY